MRVSQIQNLSWAGNVLVLAALCWVGWQFWQVKGRKPAKDPAWPQVKAVDTGAAGRWPGELAAFSSTWMTPVNGKVPPPPKPAEAQRVETDPVVKFRTALKLEGGLSYIDRPELSQARVTFAGQTVQLVPGEFLELEGKRWQLLAFDFEAATGAGRVTFRHPDKGEPVVVEDKIAKGVDVVQPGADVFQRSLTPGRLEPGTVKRDRVLQLAYQDPVTKDWVIPAGEQDWIEVYGRELLWDKLAAKPAPDGRGIQVKSMPEAGTPLGPTHGILPDDIVRSVNGVAVSSKEDVLAYLQGAGAGLERYVVVVESMGRERTVVYRVPRARRVRE